MDKLLIFIPSSKFSLEENKLAIIRFCVYACVLMLLFNNIKMCIVFLVIIILIEFIFMFKIKDKSYCRSSTINNPMKNVLLYSDNQQLNDCNDNTYDNLNYNVYYNEKDLFHTKNNLRPFITNASTKYPNDIDQFKNFLYNNQSNLCKEYSNNCKFNHDMRYDVFYPNSK